MRSENRNAPLGGCKNAFTKFTSVELVLSAVSLLLHAGLAIGNPKMNEPRKEVEYLEKTYLDGSIITDNMSFKTIKQNRAAVLAG